MQHGPAHGEDGLKKRVSFLALLVLVAALVTAVLFFHMSGCSSSSHGSDVVASVNGKKLLRSDLDRYYKQQLAAAAQPPEGAQADSLRLNILQTMISEATLLPHPARPCLL